MDEIATALVTKDTSIPPELHDRIRLFDVRQHRDYREFQPSQALSTAGLETSFGAQFFAEPISVEEEEAGELDRFLLVVHFQKDFTRLHGVPVKFVVKPVCHPLSPCKTAFFPPGLKFPTSCVLWCLRLTGIARVVV